MPEIVSIKDTISVEESAPIIAKIGADRVVTRVNPDLGVTQVSLSDAYQVVPYAKRMTLDFQLPESISQGLFVDIDTLNAALLAEVANREVAIVEAKTYAKDYADGVESQVYNTIDATFIADATNDAYVSKTEMTTLALDYDTGTGTTLATLQDIYSTGVSNGNAQAGYSADITAIADNTTALATRTTTLETSTADAEARLVTVEGVSSGIPYKLTLDDWNNRINAGGPVGTASFTVMVGMYKESATATGVPDVSGIYWQYMGGTLGTSGWYQVATPPTSGQSWTGAASSLLFGPSGEITGWEYADGSIGESVFGVNAENFYIQNNANSIVTRPFEITAGGDIAFVGKVTFSSSIVDDNGDPYVVNQTFAQPTAPTIGMIAGDTWIDTDDSNTLYTYDGAAWVVGAADGATTYLQPLEPTVDLLIGDLWFDTDDNYKQRRWNGTGWDLVNSDPATTINDGTTKINGALLQTGTALASSIGTEIIYDSTHWVGGVEQASNVYNMKIDLSNGEIHIK